MNTSASADRNAGHWRWFLLLGLFSRLMVLSAGSCVIATSEPANSSTEPSNRWIESWYRFDANWYARIPTTGYAFVPGEQCSAAFLPLLPLLLKLATFLQIDVHWAGLIIPNLAFIPGLAFFGQWIRESTRDSALARRAAWLLVAYPGSVFFSLPYQESLAFTLCAFALWAWNRGYLVPVAIALFLATLARSTSLAIAIGILLHWWLAPSPRVALWKILLILIASGLGLVLFFLHLHVVTGQIFAHQEAHRAWDRAAPSLAGLWVIAGKLLNPASHMGTEYCIAASLLVMGVRSGIQGRTLNAVVILAPLLLAFSTGTLLSIQRIALACFPAAVEVAQSIHHRWLFRLLLAFGFALQTHWINDYMHLRFIG